MALARKPWVVIDAEILSSSVWSEKPHVRLVWLTMLVLCDTDGYVGAAIPGIATAAGVSLQECEEALERLQAPDSYSRTKANEGRRVAPAERGWQILNFREHIDRMSSDRAAARARTQRWREKKRRHGDGRDVTGDVGNREKGIGNREQRTTDQSNDHAREANPLLGPGEIQRRVSEGYRLIRWIATFKGKYPEDVLIEGAHYEGAKRQKVRLGPPWMTEDRTINTVSDLRAEWEGCRAQDPAKAQRIEADDSRGAA